MQLYVQALISGVLAGGLLAILALGVTLNWGFLKIINLAHFGIVLLAAYCTYALARLGVDPLLAALLVVPGAFAVGFAVQWLFDRFDVNEFNSLLVTFGLLIVLVEVVHKIWSADFRRLTPEDNPYGTSALRLGDYSFQWPLLIGLVVAVVLVVGLQHVLQRTFVGTALLALSEDRPVASLFGVDQALAGRLLAGTAAAIGALAGGIVTMNAVLFPDLAYEWFGLVFAAVILGGIGRPVGALAGGILIGVVSAMTSTIWNPTVAPLITFIVLIATLLLRPQGLFGKAVA